jgi:hypothetical protein
MAELCHHNEKLWVHKLKLWKHDFEFFFLWYWSLNSGPKPWATLPAHFCDAFLLSFFTFFLYHFYIYLHVYTLFLEVVGKTERGATSHPPFWADPIPPSSFVLQFCWRENIKGNKRNSVSASLRKRWYTERSLVLFPYTCVLQQTLVHLYQTSSLLPSHTSHRDFWQLKIYYIGFNTVSTPTTFKF